MSEITNDGLTLSGTGCYLYRCTHNGNSGRQWVRLYSSSWLCWSARYYSAVVELFGRIQKCLEIDRNSTGHEFEAKILCSPDLFKQGSLNMLVISDFRQEMERGISDMRNKMSSKLSA